MKKHILNEQINKQLVILSEGPLLNRFLTRNNRTRFASPVSNRVINPEIAQLHGDKLNREVMAPRNAYIPERVITDKINNDLSQRLNIGANIAANAKAKRIQKNLKNYVIPAATTFGTAGAVGYVGNKLITSPIILKFELEKLKDAYNNGSISRDEYEAQIAELVDGGE